MEIKLDKDEVMKALSVYMYLKGFEIEKGFTFHTKGKSSSLLGVTLHDVQKKQFKLEDIEKYANINAN